MHVIQVEDEKLSWSEVPPLERQQQHALMRVKATGVNRADLLQRKGLYPPPSGASEVLGLEISGIIEELPKDAEGWQIGDRVMALLSGGGYATHATVPMGMLLPVPDAWSFPEAASVPEALYTSYINLITEGQLQGGQAVLIHAGAGGIGSTAIQLAKQFGASVVATASSEEKLEFCRSLGADAAVNYKHENLVEALTQQGPNGFDLIFDTVGGQRYTTLHPKLLKKYGRWIIIGLLGGRKAEINFALVLQKNLRIIGSTLRSRPEELKKQLTREIREKVLPFYEEGQLKPVLDQVFPISQVEEAHFYMAKDQSKGKVVLQVDDPGPVPCG